jgi:hypothetical protein
MAGLSGAPSKRVAVDSPLVHHNNIMNVYTRLVVHGAKCHDMGTRTYGGDGVVPTGAPLDAVDTLLTGGGAFGLLLYVVALLLGNAEVATVGVGVGVACVLGTLAIRSGREAVRALG